MFKRPRAIRSASLLFVLILIVVALAAGNAAAGTTHSVVDFEHLGTVIVPTGTMFMDTEVGGISGLAYDARRGVYYALSDDRSEIDPARFYTVDVDLSDGTLDDGDVTFLDVTFLRDRRGRLFTTGSLDPESIDLFRPGQLYISTEGDSDSDPVIDPFINRFNPAGKQNRALRVPYKFLPDGTETFGVQDNLGFESLTSTPNRRNLYAATENALAQDGPRSTLLAGSPSRFLQYDMKRRRPADEYIYCVNPIPKDSDPPGGFADMGLVEIQALDDHGTFLTMERSFASGVGNTILLFEAKIDGATDVSGIDSLNLTGCDTGSLVPMNKRQVVDLGDDLGLDLDNMEAMAFGPQLPDGRWLLILVSDNNFNFPFQETLFIALAVTVAPGS